MMVQSNLFPEDLRLEYDHHVLDASQRTAKAVQLQNALTAAKLWQMPMRILDVGCGSALILAALDAPKALRVGCDIRVEPFLKANVDGAVVAFAQADAACLPFRGSNFDLVICLAVIEEFPDWRLAVQEMAECVAPGGMLYLTMSNGKFLAPSYTLMEELGVRIEEDWWRYAESSLRFIIHSAADGFGLNVLRGWRYVNLTPHLARAQFPFLRLVPLPLLSWLLKFTAPSFGHAWQRSLENQGTK